MNRQVRNLVSVAMLAMFAIAAFSGALDHFDLSHYFTGWGGGNAYAQSAGPPVDPLGRRNLCSGTGSMSSGNLQLTADCMANMTNCQAMINQAAPATPGTIAVNCAPTSTTTGSPAATHTVVILNASTANATPSVIWWGSPK